MAIDNKNKEEKENLKEMIKIKESLAFIGAGCSKQCGYPSWSELLQLMRNEVIELYPDRESEVDVLMQERDRLWIAQELRKSIGEENFGPFIRRLFEPQTKSQNSDFYRDLVNINFRHFLTTNYDTSIEQHIRFLPTNSDPFCWHEEEKVQNFIRNLTRNSSSNDNIRFILYLHGKYDSRSEDIILSERDYAKRYRKGNLASKALWMIAAIRHVIFIGFGFEDFDLLNIFREVKWELGNEKEPRHFAIIGLRPNEDSLHKRRHLLEKYGILPIFYEVKVKQSGSCDSCKRPFSPGEENHDNLKDLISEIANTTGCNVREYTSGSQTTPLDESHRLFEYTKRHIEERRR